VKLHRLAPTVVVTLASALALAACGDDNPTESATDAGNGADSGAASEEEMGGEGGSLSGQISASGASSQASAMTAWIAGYQDVQPDVTFLYDAIGSGGGRENLLSGASPYIGSDAILDEEERAAVVETCGEGGAIHFPLYIAPVAIPYNLPGVDSLNLSPDTLAQIFDQQITTWDDPAIAEDNPDVELPDTEITAVNRSDESGTTENFLEYLTAAAPDSWSYEPSGDWPVGGGEAAAQTTGVIEVVGSTEGAIGYADASAVGELGTAAIGVGDEFVEYSAEAAAAVVDNSELIETGVEGDIALELARDTTESGNYPIVLVSYHIACSSYEDATTADIVQDFITYVSSEEGQQVAAEAAGSAPISEDLRSRVLESVELIQGGS
jgi:phosphate transport system substrate-binding protein